ncbi:MAG TPA: histidine phosphatase family protein [Burkholderiales bacterium]|nr:histidine phosphatase family protein [Burkholderiales bacterium]
MIPACPERHPTLRFVRHGATAANVLGLRCGGDLDLELVAAGRKQASEVGRRLAIMDPPVRVIVTSGLRRTLETARIIARALGCNALIVEPDFAERRLGDWNLRSIDSTQRWLEQGLTPPGGEANNEFAARVACAAHRLLTYLPDSPLVVGSKGVARVLGELSGRPGRLELANATIAEFDLSAPLHPSTAGEIR